MTTYLAADRSLAVDLRDDAIAEIIKLCSKAGGLETGGVLIGRYGPFGDRAEVARVTGPPLDSKRLPAAFIRGVRGLARRLSQAWGYGLYYVGEWHLHPSASPTPSGTDVKQTVQFAGEADYRCPHPILIVVGGASPRWSLKVSVLIRGSLLELEPGASEGSPGAPVP